MDDKKFDEIMYRYVAGKSKGENVDFAKREEKENIKTRKRPKLLWASMSCILVIVVTLAITLPLTLKPSENQVHYCYEEDMESVYVDSVAVFRTEYHIFAQLPNIEYEDIMIAIKKSKTDERILGAKLALSIFDDYFDFMDINIIFENIEVQSFASYENFSSETVWQNVPVKYNPDINNGDGFYKVQIFFQKDGYKYYLAVQYIEDMEIADMLDKIF